MNTRIKKRMQLRGAGGFTLIELLVVGYHYRHSGRDRHPDVPGPEEGAGRPIYSPTFAMPR